MNDMEKPRLYKIIITKDDSEGFYVAEVPTLSPCITYGETLEEAIEMVKEAIEGIIESRSENGYPIPDDNAILQQQKTKIETIIPIERNTSHFHSVAV
ncbi:type II toxin-antitoxin system HicB family antitoxin [Runella sp.]|jgi:predicted RNase H-like HicB family nuclease|uniref:type II toxin-antitoxin system HicB family antitoxin n=1 Tax=Runella sp. TaxID=1960881 RepID=UPI003018FD5A